MTRSDLETTDGIGAEGGPLRLERGRGALGGGRGRLRNGPLHDDAAGGVHRGDGGGLLLRRNLEDKLPTLLRENPLGSETDHTPTGRGAPQGDDAAVNRKAAGSRGGPP